MPRNDVKRIALGGMLAAVAVVLMCLGGLIPVATYACPMLCCATQFVVLRYCGKRIAWAWFAVVTILSLLMGPDKEAAMIFLTIGYYPIIKRDLDKQRLAILWKFIYFNLSILASYAVMIRVLGMEQIAQENASFGMAGMLILLAMGNATFFLLYRLLTIMGWKLK